MTAAVTCPPPARVEIVRCASVQVGAEAATCDSGLGQPGTIRARARSAVARHRWAWRRLARARRRHADNVVDGLELVFELPAKLLELIKAGAAWRRRGGRRPRRRFGTDHALEHAQGGEDCDEPAAKNGVVMRESGINTQLCEAPSLSTTTPALSLCAPCSIYSHGVVR